MRAVLLAGLLLVCACWVRETDATLRHQYTFSLSGGSGVIIPDVVSNFDAVLHGSDGSNLNGTHALLLRDGVSGSNGYIALPQHIFSALSAFTIEIWVTRGRATGIGLPLVAFGSTSVGEVSPSTPAGTPFTARNYFQWYAASGPATGGLPTMRIAYSSGTVDNEEGWDKLDPRTALPVEVTRHVAIYWDSALDQCGFHINADLAVVTGTFPGRSLSNVDDVNVWIGRSLDEAFDDFQGSINEIRIHDVRLQPSEIRESFQRGPFDDCGSVQYCLGRGTCRIDSTCLCETPFAGQDCSCSSGAPVVNAQCSFAQWTFAGPYVNTGVLTLGAEPLIISGGYIQSATGTLRAALNSGGILRTTGACAELDGRLVLLIAVPIDGSVEGNLVDAPCIAGSFASVEVQPTYSQTLDPCLGHRVQASVLGTGTLRVRVSVVDACSASAAGTTTDTSGSTSGNETLSGGTGSDKGLSSGGLIAIVVCSCVVLLVIIFLAFYWCVFRRRQYSIEREFDRHRMRVWGASKHSGPIA